jgi:hypothetical protein
MFRLALVVGTLALELSFVLVNLGSFTGYLSFEMFCVRAGFCCFFLLFFLLGGGLLGRTACKQTLTPKFVTPCVVWAHQPGPA